MASTPVSRPLSAAALAAGSVALSAFWVKWTANPFAGPVVAVISNRHGWGVHVGDFAAFPVMAAAMLGARSLRRPALAPRLLPSA